MSAALPTAPTMPNFASWLAIALLLCVLTLTGCSGDDQAAYAPTYSSTPPTLSTRCVLGVHPLHNPQKLFEIYEPLLRHLNARLGIPHVRLVLEASNTYQDFDAKLARRALHFALPNPYRTLTGQDCGYRIFAKMDNDEDFRGVIILRKDSDIRAVADLRGKSISCPAPTALAATMMPQLYLRQHGLASLDEVETLYVGTHDSALMNVLLGRTSAASTWPPAWRAFLAERPEARGILEVRWQTDTLPSNGLLVRDDVPAAVADRVRDLILGLDASPEGRDILRRIGIPRFVAADSQTFAPVAAFLREFEGLVRPLPD
ncbi:MAG: phosphate/phosphite/phosphonate ABC transporter substrate-binding protein [Solidesulfovibrio sp. DCME]|uniref:phosphate/phosphite/phosphonate ABC transporter substrate-binding protein n=1 Tax=Solidesulfovibrio sp. DCME TaxID=3447380 RepID=UPI003D0B7F2C